jgi:microcompartment protein CcmL/EutN
MQKTKSINTQTLKTETYSREKLQKSLESALDKVSSKSCNAIYITPKENTSVEAVLLDINVYRELQQQLQSYERVINDSADKKLALQLERIEKKIDGIDEGIEILRDVR